MILLLGWSLVFTVAEYARLNSPDVTFPETKVSFEVRTVPVDRALTQIGRACGMNLLAGRSLKDDFVLLGVTQTPIREVCRELASVLHAQWSRTPQGVSLDRTSAATSAESTQELGSLRTYYTRALTALQDKYKNLAPWNADSAEQLARAMVALQRQEDPLHFKYEMHVAQCELEAQGASGRIVRKVLAGFSAADLAALPRKQRIVFAVNPTSEEQPLTGIGQDLASTFQQYTQIWGDAVKLVVPDWKQPTGFNYGQGNGLGAVLRGTDPPARALFTAMRFGFGSESEFELKLYDANEKLLSRSNLELDDVEGQGPLWIPSGPGSLSAKLSLSSESKLLVDALDRHLSIGPSSPLGALLMRRVEPIDPLGLAPSDALLGLARIEGRNIIALVPDTAFKLSMIAPDDLTVKRLLTDLRNDGMNLYLDGEWIRGEPICRSIAREDRLDRSGLRMFLAKVLADGPDIDSMADFAIAHGSDIDGPIASPILNLFSPQAKREFGKSDWKTLRIYGFLTPFQRAELRAGKPIPKADWSAALEQDISVDLFRSWTHLNPAPDLPGNNYLGSLDVLDEPDEALPTGLLPAAYLTGTTAATNTVTGPVSPIPGFPLEIQELSAADIAAGIRAIENPSWAKDGKFRRAVLDSSTQLVVGTKSKLELHVRLSPVYQLNGTLASFTPSRDAVTINSLPPWLDEKVKKFLEFFRTDPVAGGGTVTPPPP